MASNNYFTKEIEMEKQHGGIGVKLTLETKCFHNWTKACNPCKNEKSSLPKTATR
jgi:hypothetical protein